MTERQMNQLRQLTAAFRDPSPEALQTPTVQRLFVIAGRVRKERSVLSVADAAFLENFWTGMIGKTLERRASKVFADRVRNRDTPSPWKPTRRRVCRVRAEPSTASERTSRQERGRGNAGIAVGTRVGGKGFPPPG